MGEIASASQLRMSFIRWALVVVPFVVFLGIASGQFAGVSGNRWFEALEKPDYIPPDWAFGAAWSITYLLLGFALAFVLAARGARRRPVAITLFMIGFLLNLAWAPLFFIGHQVMSALVLIGVMFAVTLGTAIVFYLIRELAALLLVPYLVWLIFAGLLTYEILLRNPGAATLVPEPEGTEITL